MCLMTAQGGRVHGILSFAIEWMNDEDRVALQQRLNLLIQAHPTLRIQVNAFEDSLSVSGDDELELIEFREKIAPYHEANVREVTVSYKESIRRQAEAAGKYIRQTGGFGNYGHVKIRVEPNELGKGFEFVNDIKGGVVPTEYIKPTEEGIREVLRGGVVAGCEIVDVKATLFDGSYHEFDSNKMAFTLPARLRSRKRPERLRRC